MLVNCPKCGFSQPKDRYCASCGVDMELFRPKETPTWKKILGNPVLHVALIFVIVLASLLFIRQNREAELKSRIELLKGGPVLVERQQKPPVEVSATQQAQAEIARENSPSAPPPAQTPAPQSAAAAALPAPDGSKTANDKAPGKALETKNVPNRAVILYAEVDRSLLSSWMEEMRAAGQVRNFDEVTMGVLPQAAQKIKGARGIKILQQMEQPLQAASPNYEWFVGTHKTRDPENEMGFFSSLALSEVKDGLIKGELEVQRAFRDPKDPSKSLERVSFGGPFELANGGAYIIRGLLPRKFVTDLSLDNNSDPFLSIFNSRSFANGQTEFTLILQFDSGGPTNR